MTQDSGICTLFEGDYHIGLAAFVNSLHQRGYAGTVWAGYRGALPPWIDQLEQTGDPGAYLVGGSIRLVFIPIQTGLHFANYKPTFMLELLAGQARDCSYLWYFDPDIFIKSSWSFFRNWQNGGIALCQEIVDNILPENAPLRHMWMEAGESLGLRSPRPLEHYYNSGMVGLPAEQAGFLETWKRLIEYAGKSGCDLREFIPGNREHPFHVTDQDALNVAAMYSQCPLTTLGPQGMGFVPGTAEMYHTVGTKPWRAKFVRRALTGFPPSSAQKYFFTQVSAPICAYSDLQLRFLRFSCSMAAFIGRFYGRQ